LNGMHRFWSVLLMLIYLAKEINAMKKMQKLLDGSKHVGRTVYGEEVKYLFKYRHQETGENRNLVIANKSLENLSHFK